MLHCLLLVHLFGENANEVSPDEENENAKPTFIIRF